MTFRSFSWAVVAVTLLGSMNASQAAIMSSGSGATLRYGYHNGPGGGMDANTAHLWQIDESAVPFADSTTIGGNAADLGFISGTPAQISSILEDPSGASNKARVFVDTGTTRISYGAVANTAMPLGQWNSIFGANNANTVDFIVRPNFAPANTPATGSSGMRVISTEGVNDANQLRIEWNAANSTGSAADRNKLQYTVGNQTVIFDIPLDVNDDNAFTAANQWFHVAFVYEGTGSDQVNFYWTKIDGPDTALALATTEANFVSTLTLAADTTIAATGPEFNLGNRPSGSRAFEGALDMVRMSSIARGANEFIFVPEPSSVWLVSVGLVGTAGCWRRRRKM